jgi:hypothetical protein
MLNSIFILFCLPAPQNAPQNAYPRCRTHITPFLLSARPPSELPL